MGCSTCGKGNWRRSALALRRVQRAPTSIQRNRKRVSTPQEAKQQMKGAVVPEKTVDVDATTGFPKELIKTGKVSGPVLDNPITDENVTFEDKVPEYK